MLAWSREVMRERIRVASGPMSATSESRETALPARFPIFTDSSPSTNETICPSLTSSRLGSTPSASTPANRLATWPWWSAPNTSITRSKPRTRNLSRW